MEEKITKEDLLKEMDFVSERMASLSDLMRYFGGFSKGMNSKADQLKSASAILANWADFLDENCCDICKEKAKFKINGKSYCENCTIEVV
jgi:hypothetical protein